LFSIFPPDFSEDTPSSYLPCWQFYVLILYWLFLKFFKSEKNIIGCDERILPLSLFICCCIYSATGIRLMLCQYVLCYETLLCFKNVIHWPKLSSFIKLNRLKITTLLMSKCIRIIDNLFCCWKDKKKNVLGTDAWLVSDFRSLAGCSCWLVHHSLNNLLEYVVV
jgi:hypothetical protein